MIFAPLKPVLTGVLVTVPRLVILKQEEGFEKPRFFHIFLLIFVCTILYCKIVKKIVNSIKCKEETLIL